MNEKPQMNFSVKKENIEPYQYQLIEKKFSFLLRSFPEESSRDSTVHKIHSFLQQGHSEENICGMFLGRQFPLSNCVAFASGKGGVGKSMLAVNTAVSYCARGKKVLLFDADYGLSNAHIYLNFRTSKSLLDYFLSGDPEDGLEVDRVLSRAGAIDDEDLSVRLEVDAAGKHEVRSGPDDRRARSVDAS